MLVSTKCTRRVRVVRITAEVRCKEERKLASTKHVCGVRLLQDVIVADDCAMSAVADGQSCRLPFFFLFSQKRNPYSTCATLKK